MFSEDLDVFLADQGVSCTVGNRMFLGLLDKPDELLAMGSVNVSSTMYALTVKTSDVRASAIRTGTTIAVLQPGATVPDNFKVRDPLALDDGAFTQMTISKI